MSKNLKYKTSKYIKKVKRKDGYALYHSFYGNLCLIDKAAFNLLKSFQNEKIIDLVLKKYSNLEERKNAKKIIKEFIKRGFIFKSGSDELSDFKRFVEKRNRGLIKGKEIGLIQLVVTNKCNFRCKYCFLELMYCSEDRIRLQKDPKNQIMTKQDAKKYIQKVIDLIIKNKGKELYILFTGGEPLTNWPVVKYVFDEFGNGKKHGLKINYSIDTNGSLITDEIAKYLKKYNANTIVSFDSTHGKVRVLANGENSISIIMKNIKLLNKYKNRIALNTAITTETFPYFGEKYNYNKELVDFAANNGVSEIGIIFELNFELYKKFSIEEIVRRAWEFYKYVRQNDIEVTGYWISMFHLIFENKHYNQAGFKTCYATGPLLSIEPSGAVYSCKFSSAYFGNMNNFSEIFSSENYEKYAKLPFEKKDICNGCEIENFCSNICLGVREKKFGTISKMYEPTCSLYKELIKKLILDLNRDELTFLSLDV